MGKYYYTIVCGGRKFSDQERVTDVLTRLRERVQADGWTDVVVIEGGANGADTRARRAAEALGIPTRRMNADWKAEPKLGGLIRNQAMADYVVHLVEKYPGSVGAVVAFPGGTGTAHMVETGHEMGLTHIVLKEPQPA